jgi:hypothetical protein
MDFATILGLTFFCEFALWACFGEPLPKEEMV